MQRISPAIDSDSEVEVEWMGLLILADLHQKGVSCSSLVCAEEDEVVVGYMYRMEFTGTVLTNLVVHFSAGTELVTKIPQESTINSTATGTPEPVTSWDRPQSCPEHITVGTGIVVSILVPRDPLWWTCNWCAGNPALLTNNSCRQLCQTASFVGSSCRINVSPV